MRSRHASHPNSHASSPMAALRYTHSSAGAELPGWPGVVDGSAGSASALGTMASEDLGTPRLGSSPAAVGPSSPSRLSSAAAAAALPPGSPLVAPGGAPRRHGSQQEAEEVEEAGGAAGAGVAFPAQGLAGPLPEGLPSLLGPDFAVNAFVTRLAFDLLRRPDFQASRRLLASQSRAAPLPARESVVAGSQQQAEAAAVASTRIPQSVPCPALAALLYSVPTAAPLPHFMLRRSTYAPASSASCPACSAPTSSLRWR